MLRGGRGWRAFRIVKCAGLDAGSFEAPAERLPRLPVLRQLAPRAYATLRGLRGAEFFQSAGTARDLAHSLIAWMSSARVTLRG